MAAFVYCETHGAQVTSHPAPGGTPTCPKCGAPAEDKEDYE